MGLDELHLRVLSTSSENATEKRNAQKGKLWFWGIEYESLTQWWRIVLNLMQKGRHWVLVVSNPHLYRLYQYTCGFVSGITARQRGSYWSPRYLPTAQNHSPANQIVNESLPIFLDSAVRFIIAIRKTEFNPFRRTDRRGNCCRRNIHDRHR